MEKTKLILGVALWIAMSLVQLGVFTQRMNTLDNQIHDLRQDVSNIQVTLMRK